MCIRDRKPYFDTLATYNSLYPISSAMVEELGGPAGVKSMNNENMWYNGCYTMTSYIQGNEKTYTKNPLYWDTECKRFDTVTYKMVESNDIVYQMYENMHSETKNTKRRSPNTRSFSLFLRASLCMTKRFKKF